MSRLPGIASVVVLALVSAALAVLSVVPSIFLHPLGWPLPLIAVTAGALLLALPAGWPRVLFSVVWVAMLVLFGMGRVEGGLVIGNSLPAYLLFVLAAVWVVMSLITLPRRRARHSDPGPVAT